MTEDAEPFVSVIVPVYNDPSGIRVTLSSLVEQTSPTWDHEILVVDNNSTDGTRAVIREFEKDYYQIHLLIEDEIQSSYAARNRGIREARGDLLVFLDADMWVEESWLAEVVESMNNHNAPYMGCNVEIRINGNHETLVERFIRDMQWDIEGFIENDNFAPTACLVIQRELLDAVGPFDDRFVSAGDMEFGQRINEVGFEQRFEPSVTVYHPARSSLQALFSKMFRVGRGLFQYYRYHPERFNKAIWSQPGSYLPPHPLRFYHRLKQKRDSSYPAEFICFYVIAYSIRLSRMAGAVYEYVKKLYSQQFDHSGSQ